MGFDGLDSNEPNPAMITTTVLYRPPTQLEQAVDGTPEIEVIRSSRRDVDARFVV